MNGPKARPGQRATPKSRITASNAFNFVDGSGGKRAVRWSMLPQAEVVPISPEDLAKLGPDHLEQEIVSRVAQAPQRWTMAVTLADPGDPTSDPSKAWPKGRRSVEVGTLVVEKIEAESDGPCRDINFDPTILPDGISLSDDPFPAARSSAYAKSFDLRTAEARHYPYRPQTATGAQP